MSFYQILLHAHSGLRWLLLAAILFTIVYYLRNWMRRKDYVSTDKKWALLTLIFTHLQLVIGLIMYFISPKVVFSENTMSDSLLRYFTVEHISVMLIAIVLITIGYGKLKGKSNSYRKYKQVFWFYFIALVLMLSRIPWPGQGYGSSWF